MRKRHYDAPWLELEEFDFKTVIMTGSTDDTGDDGEGGAGAGGYGNGDGGGFFA